MPLPSRAASPAFPFSHEPVPLSRVPVGVHRLVSVVAGPARDELELEGLLPGSVIVVRARTPLGGPLVVELGRTRLALSTNVAASVFTLPVTIDRDAGR